MGSCIICGTSVDGRICDLHEQDVVFEFRGTKPDELTPGRFYRGTVDGYAEFGVFVDIGDSVTGLLHRSEIDQRLDSLDQYVMNQAQRIPEERRVLITSHDAFRYLGQAYDIEVRGLQGISTATEAGTQDVQTLADFVVTRRIPALFVESSVSPRGIEAVQAAVRSKGFRVQLGGTLYGDALDNRGTPTGTYIGALRHNIDTIVQGLLNDPTQSPTAVRQRR